MCQAVKNGWFCCHCRKYANIHKDKTCKGCGQERCPTAFANFREDNHALSKPGKTCPQCSQVMTETFEDYPFYHRTSHEENCKSVTLKNIRINRCLCGETVVTIPKIEELHHFLDNNLDAILLAGPPWHSVS